MVFIFVPFFFGGEANFGRQNMRWERDNQPQNRQTNENRRNNDNWQFIVSALMPFLFTTLTFGGVDDFIMFLPVILLALLTTRNSLSDYLARTNPSILIISLLAVASLTSVYYENSNPAVVPKAREVPRSIEREDKIVTSNSSFDWAATILGPIFFVCSFVFTSAFYPTSVSHRLFSYVPARVIGFIGYIFRLVGLPVPELPIGSVPASKQALEDILNTSYTITEQDLLCENSPTITCAICLERRNLGDKVVKFACGHMFDANCVHSWLQKHCTCPTCRFEIETDNKIYEYQRKLRQPGKSTTYFSKPITKTKKPEGVVGVETEDLNLKSVPELKQMADKFKVDVFGIIEKKDLVEAIKKAVK